MSSRLSLCLLLASAAFAQNNNGRISGTVTDATGSVITVSGELSSTIDSQQVQDLALNGRNYLQLVSLMPGVALLDEDQMATTTSLSVTTWTANGARAGTAHLMVDGGMNLDSGSNGS